MAPRSNHPDLRLLDTDRWELRQLERLSDQVLARRDARARELYDAGVPVRDLAIACDISEGRMYQVLRARTITSFAALEIPEARIEEADEHGTEWLAFPYEAETVDADESL